jgi:hypothetical protein
MVEYINNENISVLPDDIFIIHNLLLDTFCENIRNIIDTQANQHITSYTPVSAMLGYVTTLGDISIDNILIKQDISLLLSGYVRAITNIISKFNNNIFQSYIPKISNIEFRKLSGETRQHIDNINRDSPRLLTCIIMLNDDYDDGIFSFPKQNVHFKPKKGDVILFPPYWTHPHKVSSPTNGFRYAITFWYNHHTDIHSTSIR